MIIGPRYVKKRIILRVGKAYILSGSKICIVNAGKTAHFLLNFTLNKIKLVQIMNNRVYFVRNTCYFEVQ